MTRGASGIRHQVSGSFSPNLPFTHSPLLLCGSLCLLCATLCKFLIIIFPQISQIFADQRDEKKFQFYLMKMWAGSRDKNILITLSNHK